MKKLIIAVLISLFFCSISFAFTAQTKGTVFNTYWSKGVKVYRVWIDSEGVLINKSIPGVQRGDDVIVNVELEGPMQPILSIVYKFNDDLPVPAPGPILDDSPDDIPPGYKGD